MYSKRSWEIAMKDRLYKANGQKKRLSIIISLIVAIGLLIVVGLFVLSKGQDKKVQERLAKKKEEIEELKAEETTSTISENRIDENDVVNVEEIILYSESQNTMDDDIPIEMLEKVSDSSVSYVAVGGYGDPQGMGVHYQNFTVGVNPNPIEGYKYARCE